MEKSIFEWMGGTYHKQGNYLLPDLAVPEEDKRPIGVWGQRHLRYIREHRKGLYFGLQLSGKLDSYLADIDHLAEDMFLWLFEQMVQTDGISEELKVSGEVAWIGEMNNIRNRAIETILAELIYI